jgi:hypothetical protein
MRTVRDPHLAAIEDKAIALLLGTRAHRGDVGAGIGLRDCKRADMRTRNKLRQIALLLRGAAVQAELVHAEVRVGAVGQSDRAGCAGDFLHDDAVLEIAEPEPAELLRHRDAVHAELAKLGPQIAREGIAAIDLGGARRDARGREAAHALAQHVRGFPQPEIEPAKTACQHGLASCESGSLECGTTAGPMQLAAALHIPTLLAK